MEGDTRPFLKRQVAALETRLAHERSEQRRLTGAVGPGERDAVAALDLERHPVEQRVAGKLLAEVGCNYDGHRCKGTGRGPGSCSRRRHVLGAGLPVR